MSDHPFRYSYVGLGLLDEASIHQERHRGVDRWVADYPDLRGRPYLRVGIEPSLATIEEFDTHGERVAMTVSPSLTDAIGRHGAGATNAEGARDGVSRFWVRAISGAISIWTPIDATVRYSFIPAMGLATVYIPAPRGSTWVNPAPGPVATRIERDFDEDDGWPRPATLYRWPAEDGPPTTEPIDIHAITVQGILLAELADAIKLARGPLRSIEWRPFASVNSSTFVRNAWPASVGHARPDMVSFAIGREAKPLRRLPARSF